VQGVYLEIILGCHQHARRIIVSGTNKETTVVIELQLNDSPLHLIDVRRDKTGRITSGKVVNGQWLLKIRGDIAYCYKIPGTDHWIPLKPGKKYVTSFKINSYKENNMT